MINSIFILMMLLSTAFAADITESFQRKNFQAVSEIYKANPKREFTDKELVYISFSLRKLGFYRQDIKLNIRLIKKRYQNLHRKLVKDISESETIDGEEYPEGLKVLYWNLMNDYGIILESYKTHSALIKKDHDHYLVFSKFLSELEFREGKVDKFNDRITAHIQNLKNKVYKFSKSLSFQYVSWQTDATLKGAGTSTGLVVTNRGVCAGGDAGYENAQYHFYVDGCVFAGSGGVASDSSSLIRYRQSNVTAYGIKAGPGASMIVSTSGSRIGLRLPMIYTIQKLQDPSSSDYSVEQNTPFSIVASLYSRWQFKKWYFQTEFGKYVQQEQTFWGLGIGKRF